MYDTFKKQLDKIFADSDKKATDEKTIPQIAMLKFMASAIDRFVENEARINKGFSDALSYEWKSCERMLKFVWNKAKKLAAPLDGIGSGVCVPDDMVYDWVAEYYALDDKAEVEKEIAEAKEKAEKEKKRKKEEARRESDARREAYIQIREGEDADDYIYISVKDLEKLIKEKARTIKYNIPASSSAPTKKSVAKKTSNSKSEGNPEPAENGDTSDECIDEVEDVIAEETKEEPADTISNNNIVENAECKIETSEDEDGQFSLLDLVS